MVSIVVLVGCMEKVTLDQRLEESSLPAYMVESECGKGEGRVLVKPARGCVPEPDSTPRGALGALFQCESEAET